MTYFSNDTSLCFKTSRFLRTGQAALGIPILISCASMQRKRPAAGVKTEILEGRFLSFAFKNIILQTVYVMKKIIIVIRYFRRGSYCLKNVQLNIDI